MSRTYILDTNQLGAFSVEQGIAISTTAFTDIQKSTIFVSYDKDGNLKTDYLNQSIALTYSDFQEMNPKQEEFTKNISTGFQLLILTIAVGLTAIIANKNFTFFMVFFSICIYATNTVQNLGWFFGNALYHIRHKQLGRYHAAEHMALKAYKRLHHVPSLEEIKKESRFDEFCSTVENTTSPLLKSVFNTIFLTIAVSCGMILLNLVLCNTNSFWIHAITIPFAIIYILGIEKIINFIHEKIDKWSKTPLALKLTQWSVLADPTDKDLLLAQEAVKRREEIDQYIWEHKESLLTEEIDIDVKVKQVFFTVKSGQKFAVSIDEYSAWIDAHKTAKIVEENNEKETNS